jgi:hypothetical protein
MYVCVRGGPNQPLHRDPQWSIEHLSLQQNCFHPLTHFLPLGAKVQGELWPPELKNMREKIMTIIIGIDKKCSKMKIIVMGRTQSRNK